MAEQGGIAVGKQFGDYRLVRLLGQGSFGSVYLGEHVHDKTFAAVKVLQTRITDSEGLKEFINEARTFRLRHPHIVQLLDFGISDENIPFLIMDYAPGGTLRARHLPKARLPISTVVHYVKQIAAALQYAHDRKLIHRDVKPENMLLTANDSILVSDFGIAVVAQSSRSLHTLNGAGTVPYMAPEQLQGKPRPASDQYALGIIVYEWLCGERPFCGTPIEIAMQHALTAPPSLTEKLPGLAHEIEQVVMTALAKDPKQRFMSVKAFATALEKACLATSGRDITSNVALLPIGYSISTYHGHSSAVKSASWAPDSRHIVSSAYDDTVQVWNVITGRTVLKYSGHSSGSDYVTWSPDGKYIASAGYHSSIHIWDAMNGNIRAVHPGDSRENRFAWSPDGKYIASVEVITIHIWDASTGKTIVTCSPHFNGINVIAWSPDGNYIASGSGSSDDAVKIWDVQTGMCILTYSGHYSGVRAIAWSPDGKYIASGGMDRGGVRVCTSGTGELVRIYGNMRPTKVISWAPSGPNIVSDTHGIEVWNAFTGTPSYKFDNFPFELEAMSWSPDGQLILCAVDQVVHVWKGTNTTSSSQPYQSEAEGMNPLGVSLAPGTIMFSTSGSFSQAVWSPDGKFIASIDENYGVGKKVSLWDITSKDRVLTYDGHSDGIQAVSWSPDGKRMASVSGSFGYPTLEHEDVQVWQAETGQKLFSCKGQADKIEQFQGLRSVSWAPDGRQIVFAGCDYAAQVWDTLTGQYILTCHNLSAFISFNIVTWSPDGTRIAGAGVEGKVWIWNAATGEHLLTYDGHSANIATIAWSPTGKYIASGSDDTTIQVWDSASGDLVFTYLGHTPKKDNGEQILDTDNDSTDESEDESSDWDEEYPYYGPNRTGFICILKWSPDGKRIASSAVSNPVHVWDALNGDNVFLYRGHSRRDVLALAWAPDGNYIVSVDIYRMQIWQAVSFDTY